MKVNTTYPDIVYTYQRASIEASRLVVPSTGIRPENPIKRECKLVPLGHLLVGDSLLIDIANNHHYSFWRVKLSVRSYNKLYGDMFRIVEKNQTTNKWTMEIVRVK